MGHVRYSGGAQRSGSQALLDVLLSSIDHGVLIMDITGHILMGNEAAAEQLGYRDLEALYRSSGEKIAGSWESFDQDGRLLAKDELPTALALSGHPPMVQMLRSQHRETGREVWNIVRAVPILDDAGHVISALTIFHDITETWLAQERLRQSEARYRELIEATDDLVAWLDLDFRFLYVNRAMCRCMGMDRDDLQGQVATNYVHPEDLPKKRALISELAEENREDPLKISFRVITPDGRTLHLATRQFLSRDRHGAVVGYQSLARDVTGLVDLKNSLDDLDEVLQHLIPDATP